MAFLEAVTVQHQRAASPRQVRISRNVKRAIDLMVHECQKRPEAAQTVGITDDAMRKAMLKPEVMAYLNTQKGVLRTSAEARTLRKAEQLMDSAKSETVQLEAVKYISPPVQRSENIHIHQGHVPGLTLIFGAAQAPGDDALLITDLSAQSDKARIINALPKPVQHPAMLNASDAVEIETPPASKTRRRRPGAWGQK